MSTQSKRFLNAIDLKVLPQALAREVADEGSDSEHNWLIMFLESFVGHMANLEESQGGYYSMEQAHMSAYCKNIQGSILEAQAIADEMEYEGKHAND